MRHIEEISSIGISEDLLVKLSGRYYTHEKLSRVAIKKFLKSINTKALSTGVIRIVDPFGGDGRLIVWLIEEWNTLKLPNVNWDIHIWDINEIGLIEAENNFERLKEININYSYSTVITDSFVYAQEYERSFDIVITNPPWELLKPDSRELKNLTNTEKDKYIETLKNYDNKLLSIYPDSQPEKKFAGWGTNLSRVGLDVSLAIMKNNGCCLIVLPASFFADGQSKSIRRKIFEETQIKNISFYPAEAKLFGKADVDSSTMTFVKTNRTNKSFDIFKYDKNLILNFSDKLEFNQICDTNNDYNIPLNGGLRGIHILNKIKARFAQWGAIENQQVDGLWAGREVDETRINEFLSDTVDGYKFIKGRMIDRFQIKEQPNLTYTKELINKPKSLDFEKIVWRDVSRSNQKRRIIATIVPANIIAGNSLGVCYFSDNDNNALKILLGIMNSFCFEFQLRNHLATGHISLSAIRKVSIPDRSQFSKYGELVKLVNNTIKGDTKIEYEIEAFVAKFVYELTAEEFNLIINSFEKITTKEKNELLKKFENIKMTIDETPDKKLIGEIKIPNHLSSNLSELDMLVVHSVPPGGNWKNIPLDVPSNRIKQIRESFKAGNG
ncbi:MAG TPA: Alw26I/Eco31I/Esp3I family type II restriction adenine-specific DNA-methyltransferase, partial [Flavobacteriaceae bacterium]